MAAEKRSFSLHADKKTELAIIISLVCVAMILFVGLIANATETPTGEFTKGSTTKAVQPSSRTQIVKPQPTPQAMVCGNGVCEPGEASSTCPEDCKCHGTIPSTFACSDTFCEVFHSPDSTNPYSSYTCDKNEICGLLCKSNGYYTCSLTYGNCCERNTLTCDQILDPDVCVKVGCTLGTLNYYPCDSTVVYGGYCGDGIVNGPEECDAGANNGKICSAAVGQTCNYCGTDCKIYQYTNIGPVKPPIEKDWNVIK